MNNSKVRKMIQGHEIPMQNEWDIWNWYWKHLQSWLFIYLSILKIILAQWAKLFNYSYSCMLRSFSVASPLYYSYPSSLGHHKTERGYKLTAKPVTASTVLTLSSERDEPKKEGPRHSWKKRETTFYYLGCIWVSGKSYTFLHTFFYIY